MNLLIRPYLARDRAALRRLCCDTAESGAPTQFPDRELVADLVSGYYTDHEPEHCWVAEADGQVVGYLTGCLDSARWRRWTWFWLGPVALLKALMRGTFCRPQAWRYRPGGRPVPRSVYREYPAHLHLNVAAGCRGQQIGRRLLGAFEQQVRARGLGGIHANVRAENEAGRNSFARLGFSPIASPAQPGSSLVHGKKL